MTTETSRTPNVNLMLHNESSGSTVKFKEWRLEQDGDVNSNMLILDQWSGSFAGGWVDDSANTWTISGSTGFSFEITGTVVSDDFKTGVRVELNNGGIKQFTVLSSSGDSGSSTIVILSSDPASLSASPTGSLVNSAISEQRYSRALIPEGWKPTVYYSGAATPVGTGAGTAGSSMSFARGNHSHTLGAHGHTSSGDGGVLNHSDLLNSGTTTHEDLDTMYTHWMTTPYPDAVPKSDANGVLTDKWIDHRIRGVILDPFSTYEVSPVIPIMRADDDIEFTYAMVQLSATGVEISGSFCKANDILEGGYASETTLTSTPINTTTGSFATDSSGSCIANQYVYFKLDAQPDENLAYAYVELFYRYKW